MPGTILGVGDRVVNETKSLTLSLHSGWGRHTREKIFLLGVICAMDKSKLGESDITKMAT